MTSSNEKRSPNGYKQKIIYLKQQIREYVHENAALVDELEEVNINIIIRNEERKFLLRRLCQYEPQVLREVQNAAPKKSGVKQHSPVNQKKQKKKATNSHGTRQATSKSLKPTQTSSHKKRSPRMPVYGTKKVRKFTGKNNAKPSKLSL